MTSFVRFLEASRARYDAALPTLSKSPPEKTLDDIPVWAEKMSKRSRRLDCYHCHYVFDAEREQRRADKTWTRAGIWRWPPPERVGLSLAVEDLGRVADVRPQSSAAQAGIRKGDRLLTAGGVPILTALDLSFVFERAHAGATRIPLRYERAGVEAEVLLKLKAGWKVGTSLEFKWRPSKWQLAPRPGFGGQSLSADERRALSLPSQGLAFRVGYIVDWGGAPDRRYGRAARKAGIKRGDVVIGVEGAKIEDPEHLHSWWRLTRKPGQVVKLRVIPKGKRKPRVVELEVLAPQD